MSFQPTARLRLAALYAAAMLIGGGALITGSFIVAARHVDAYPREVNELVAGLGRRPPKGTPARTELEQLPSRAQLERQTRVAAEREIRVRTRKELLFSLGALLAAFALFAVVTAFILAGRVLRPIAAITRAAQKVAAGALDERLRLAGPRDELTQLADTFDEMLASVEGAFLRERAFIGNASHELRTPLAVIRAELDAHRSSPATPSEEARSFAVIESALDRSERLLASLLALARAERGVRDPVPVDLAATTEELIGEVGRRLPDVFDRVVTDLEKTVVEGDLILLRGLIGNLLENAALHSPGDSSVFLSTRTTDGRPTLAVENEGEILSKGEVARLAEPFFRRAPNGDRRDPGGFGLGLALVASVARAHNAKLTSIPGRAGGLRVVVSFPPADLLSMPSRTIQREAPGRSPWN